MNTDINCLKLNMKIVQGIYKTFYFDILNTVYTNNLLHVVIVSFYQNMNSTDLYRDEARLLNKIISMVSIKHPTATDLFELECINPPIGVSKIFEILWGPRD